MDTSRRRSSRSRYYPHNPPSFSSTLLDDIYHSIDDDKLNHRADAHRSRVDSWMDNIDTTNPIRRRMKTTSSSDSSSFAGFSSSDTDSSKNHTNSLKPIRTTFSDPINSDHSISDHKPTGKSRAMKLYTELKRMKQPISPGGKLATFLNSLFNAKKQRLSTSPPTYTPASTPSSSTASSYSRSCLTKTPSSSGAKRSVRFSPVSVVIDDDQDLTTDSKSGKGAVEKNRTAMEQVLKNYNHKWQATTGKEEEEDGESCCSSDLFELENLLQIGVDRYCAELPVYQTTRLHSNRLITFGEDNG